MVRQRFLFTEVSGWRSYVLGMFSAPLLSPSQNQNRDPKDMKLCPQAWPLLRTVLRPSLPLKITDVKLTRPRCMQHFRRRGYMRRMNCANSAEGFTDMAYVKGFN